MCDEVIVELTEENRIFREYKERLIQDAYNHYQIVDYILTPQDTLKETKNYGCYETREERIKIIEENMAVDA